MGSIPGRYLLHSIKKVAKPTGLNLVTQIVYYYTESTEKLTMEQLLTVFNQYGREGETVVQTIALQLRAEGREEERKRMIVKLLEDDILSHAQIAALVELPEAEIERIDKARANN